MLILSSYCMERRYREDAINVVGLTRGALIRWRYSRKHVEASCLILGRRARQKVVLAFLSEDNGLSLVPVRYATLLCIEQHGSVLEFVLKLEGYPRSSLVGVAADSELPIWYKEGLRKVGSEELVFSAPQFPRPSGGEFRESNVSLWENVVDRIFAEKTFQQDVGFLYCLCLENCRHVFWRVFAFRGGFFFESNTKVKFRVHYKISPRPREVNMKPIGEVVLGISGAALSFVTSRRVRIDAPRDSRLIELQADSGYRIHRGHLSVSINEFRYAHGKDGRAQDSFSRHDIPVATGILSPLLASLAAAFAIGLATIGLPSLGGELEIIGLALFTVLGAVGLSQGFK